MRQKLYLLTFLMVSLLVTAEAQEVLPGGWITNGPVYAVSQNSTNVYVGGYFNQVGTPRDNGVLYDVTTGEPIANMNYPDGQISSSAPDGNGGFFIAGTTNNLNLMPSFTKIGHHLRDGLAHILPNGEVSPIFNPVLTTGKSGKIILAATADRVIIGVKANNAVAKTYDAKIVCLSYDGSTIWERNLSAYGEAQAALVHNNTLYVVGRFTSVENQPRQRAAAFDLTSGTLLGWNTGSRIPALNGLVRQSIWIGIHENEIFIRCHATPTIGSQHLFSVDAVTGCQQAGA